MKPFSKKTVIFKPWNLQEQQIDVEIRGTDVEHRVLANGVVKKLGKNHFVALYPAYYTTSSFFFHVIDQNRYLVKEDIIALPPNDQKTPVTVYALKSAGQDFLDSSTADVVDALKDYSAEIGFYLHPSYLAYTSYNGGMEYCGAACVDPDSIRHEVMHSWFGRGLLPANGAAGWIDEAITTWWVDSQGETLKSDAPSDYFSKYRRQRLCWDNPYRRMTNGNCYTQGERFIAYTASLFKMSGVEFKPVLVEFLQSNARKPITNEMFLEFLRSKCPNAAQAELEKAIGYFVEAK